VGGCPDYNEGFPLQVFTCRAHSSNRNRGNGGSRIVLRGFVVGKDIVTTKASRGGTPLPRKFGNFSLEMLHFAEFSRALNKFLIFNSK